MKIVVISDIHGNCVALDAVLNDLEAGERETIVCLGDAIQGGPQPAETVARLRGIKCPVVMGNSDAWLLTGVETGSEPISADRRKKLSAVREWSLGKLSDNDKRFIESFQPTITLPLNPRKSLFCFHGTPQSFDELIFPHTPEDEFQRMLGTHASSILTGGHTHVQFTRRLGGNFFFNPGSVGMAYNHQQEDSTVHLDSFAEYAVLTCNGENSRLEFRRVNFDVDKLISVYEASGKPFADESVREYQQPDR